MKTECFLLLSVILFGCMFFNTNEVIAETIIVKNSPRPFTVVAPSSWTQQPTTTGNSRIRFHSPVKTPPAECAVIVQEYPGLKDVTQSMFDKKMAEPPSPTEFESQLSSRLNNVKVLSVGAASISGHPAQLYNVQYSVGTPEGEQWFRGISVTAGTTPGLVWIISCGAAGETLNEALKGYKYWQLEILRFPTNIKIQ